MHIMARNWPGVEKSKSATRSRRITSLSGPQTSITRLGSLGTTPAGPAGYPPFRHGLQVHSVFITVASYPTSPDPKLFSAAAMAPPLWPIHRKSSPSSGPDPPPLDPRHANLLTLSHYLLLPLLNALLLIFAIAMNNAYVYPTSLPLSLPFHLYGENIFRIFYLLLCVVALMVGAVNVYVLYTSITRLPAWRRRWAWCCERPELAWALPLPRVIVVAPASGRSMGPEGLKFGKPIRVPAWRFAATISLVVLGG
ncbi:hypothetical protein DFH27DRAFT_545101 [Peziza echinospora]|nr:hypothetical protein DFH27DRAFT_545101 [Peziza echinospora]